MFWVYFYHTHQCVSVTLAGVSDSSVLLSECVASLLVPVYACSFFLSLTPGVLTPAAQRLSNLLSVVSTVGIHSFHSFQISLLTPIVRQGVRTPA